MTPTQKLRRALAMPFSTFLHGAGPSAAPIAPVDDRKIVAEPAERAELNALRRRVDRIETWAWGKPSEPTLNCSFCNKSQHEVPTLIAGPTVFICNECVGICTQIVEGKS